MRLPGLGSMIRSSPIFLKSGALYLVNVKVRQDTWPRGNIAVSIQHSTPSGQWISNLASETSIAPFVNGEFSSSGLYFTTPSDVPYVQIVLVRANFQASADSMWVDDVQLVQSPVIRQNPSPKIGFTGTQVRISSVGNWEVRGASGTWEPWFPMCAAVNPGRISPVRYRSLATQGFNCDIWLGQVPEARTMAKAAGMRLFQQISQYTNDNGWAVGNLDALAREIRSINDSPTADAVVGYFLDNENSSDDVKRTRDVIEALRALDVVDGKRRRPILQLQGSYGSLGLWSDEQGHPFTDAVGTYISAANSGGAGSGLGGQSFLESQAGQSQPSAYCQINDGIGTKFRSALYGCIAQGSRAMSFWGDGPVDAKYPQTPFLEQQPWWPDLPAISKELEQLGPVVRAPLETRWSARVSGDNQLFPLVVGNRTVDGIGHIVLSNMSDQAQTKTITVSGLPYAATEVRDYFSNALVAAIGADETFTLVVPPAGVGSGSMVLRLVSKGWTPPVTTNVSKKKVTSTTLATRYASVR